MQSNPVVMKFGGTSIQNAQAIERVIGIIKSRANEPLAIIFSAISEATNILTHCAKLAANGQIEPAKDLLDKLGRRHHQIATELLSTHKQVEAVFASLDNFFSDARALTQGIYLTREFNFRSLDRMVGYGELASSTIIVGAMQERDLPAKWLDARDWLVTDDDFGRANPNMVEVRRRVKKLFIPLLHEHQLPVSQGYIGQTATGISTTLGREGSDYSAAILANALSADRLEIWKDVDGIMSADPDVVSNAHKIEALSYDEAAKLTLAGAKVIHPNTLLPIIEKEIPVRILNSFNPESTGTRIEKPPLATANRQLNVKCVTSKNHIVKISAVAPLQQLPFSFFGSIFNLFNKYNVAIELTNISHHHITVAFVESENGAYLLNELALLTGYELEVDNALITLVGEGLRETIEAESIFKYLVADGISLISYGSAQLSLSFLIKADREAEFVSRVHGYLFGARNEKGQILSQLNNSEEF